MNLSKYAVVVLLLVTALTGCRENYSQTVKISLVDYVPEFEEISVIPKDYKEVDPSLVHWFKVRYIGPSLGRIFHDLPEKHLSVCYTKGFKPVTDLRSAYKIDKPISKLSTCDEYTVDKLTHSLPYLQSDAHDILKTIGKKFSDSVEKRSGHRYKIIVTSVLRTPGSVAKLRRRNGNATENSAHQYGRTVDISYVNFTPEDPNYVLNQACLKNTLGEVLFDLRNQGLCYVKYEVHQGCFHITFR